MQWSEYRTCKDCGVYVVWPKKFCPPCRKNHKFTPSLKHGLCDTPTYRMWSQLRCLCRIKQIDIDPRWQNYTDFLNDMGEKPEGKSLHRIDKALSYCKDNCLYGKKYNTGA